MEFPLFLFAFALFWKSGTCIRCYQCVAELTYTAVESKCEHFDGSERFVKDCPSSSMCYKKVTALELSDGVTSKSYHRGCAAQTVNGDQKKINGKWQQVHDIHEVYEEGCQPDATDADRITKTVHCYCRGNLCNGSKNTMAQFSTTLIAMFSSLALSFVV